MSYAGHRTRVFRDAGDLPLVVPKRSEGRIKTYLSATDARAWCVDTEERRQHILDLIRADQEKCALGKYVPIEVLIDTLLANKNADIAKLRAQVDQLQMLLDMYSKLDLTEDQKRMLEGMKKDMEKAGIGLDDIASGSRTKSPRTWGESDTDELIAAEYGDEIAGKTGKKSFDTRSTCSAVSRTKAEEAAKEAAAIKARTEAGAGSVTGSAAGAGSGKAAGSASVTGSAAKAGSEKAAGSASVTGSAAGAGSGKAAGSASVTGSAAKAGSEKAAGAASVTGSAAGAGSGKAAGSASVTGSAGGAGSEKAAGAASVTGSAAGAGSGKAAGTGSVTGSAAGAGSGKAAGTGSVTGSAGGAGTGKGAGAGSLSKAGSVSGAASSTGSAAKVRIAVETETAAGTGTGAAAGVGVGVGVGPGAGAKGIIEKDAEIISLKNALAAKDAELEQQNKIARAAIEQLEALQDIVEERDQLRKKLEDSLHEIKTLKNRVEDPCVKEIAALEAEIDRLRNSGQLSPAEEAEVIRKEVEVLKKYCSKLSSIQEENGRLKTQVDRLRELSGIPMSDQDETVLPDDPSELKSRVRELNGKLAKLNEIMDERDRHKRRVQQLEKELLNYGNLPEEIEVFKQRSQMLDDIMDERDNLQQRLNNLTGLEEEVAELKRKANRVQELERQLEGANVQVGKVKRECACDTQSLKLQRDASLRELENVKAERDVLRRKSGEAASAEEEMERLKYRAQEAEVIKIERDRMKVKLDELATIEAEYKQLLEKTRGMDSLKAERDMYKQKYEELVGLECECDILKAQVEKYKQLDQDRDALVRQVRECECCIADQEDEIKRLVNHIDRMSQGSNKQQDRMQRALSDMRAELEQKTSLIATSEEQLSKVQDHLKTTIADVSCETACLRARIEELESELEEVCFKLKEKQDTIDSMKDDLSDKNNLICSLSSERQVTTKDGGSKIYEKTGSFGGDEHLEKMLTESKCAVRRVAEELGKHYEEWDCMQGKGLADEDQDLFAKYTEEKRTSLKLSNDVDELQQKIRELQKELDQANHIIAKLRGDLNVTDRLSAENQALRRHSTEIQDVAKEQIEELVGNLKSAKDRIAALEAQNAALMKETGVEIPLTADAAVDNCDELKQQLQDMQLEKGKLEKLVEQLQADQGGGGAPDVGALRMDIANLEEQLQKEIKLRQAGEERITNLTNELNGMTDSMQDKVRKSSITETELEAELRKLKAENQQLTENIKAVGDSAGRRTSQVEGEIGVIAEQNKQILKEKVALESENASLAQQLADLKQQLENLQSASGDTAELDALKQEKEALLAKISDQETQIADMVQKINIPTADASSDINREDLEKERKEKEDLENMIKNLQNQISTMESAPSASAPTLAASDSSAVNDAIAKLTQQLEQEQAKASACEDALTKLKQESTGTPGYEPLIDEMEGLKAKIKTLEQDNEKLKATGGDTSELMERIKNLEEENALLIASASGDTVALSAELSKLKQENSKMKASGSLGGHDSIYLREQLEMYENKIKELELQNDQLAAAAAGDDTVLFAQINDLKQKIKELELENKDVKGKLSRMQSQTSGFPAKDMDSGQLIEIKSISKSFEDKLKKSSASIKMLENSMNLSKEDQVILQKMKDAYEDQIKSLQDELELEKKQCEEMVASLKDQHKREVKNMSNKFNDGIAKLQGSHEEILKDVGNEYEQQVDGLRKELRSSKGEIESLQKKLSPGKGSLSVKTVENVSISPVSKVSASANTLTKTPGQKGICTCGGTAALENILHQILKHGIESLTIDELRLLHDKTRDASAAKLRKGSGSPPMPSSRIPENVPTNLRSNLTPTLPLGVAKSSSMDSQDSLLRRLSSSSQDGDLMRKQKQAQQKIGALQVAVKMERERLEELKKNLEVEKQRNNELMCKLGAQSRTVSSLQSERDTIRRMSSVNEEKVHALSGSVEQERERVKRLEDDLQRARQKQAQDSEALESMRVKLEQTVNNEMVLKMQLQQHSEAIGPNSDFQPCACDQSTSATKPRSSKVEFQNVTSFYTELSIQDVKNKRNFVNHCCAKKCDRSSSSSKTYSVQPPPKNPDPDDEHRH